MITNIQELGKELGPDLGITKYLTDHGISEKTIGEALSNSYGDNVYCAQVSSGFSLTLQSMYGTFTEYLEYPCELKDVWDAFQNLIHQDAFAEENLYGNDWEYD